MTEEALLAIEAHAGRGCGGHEDSDGSVTYCRCFEGEVVELLAEVRRLRGAIYAAGEELLALGSPLTARVWDILCAAVYEGRDKIDDL